MKGFEWNPIDSRQSAMRVKSATPQNKGGLWLKRNKITGGDILFVFKLVSAHVNPCNFIKDSDLKTYDTFIIGPAGQIEKCLEQGNRGDYG